MEKLQKDTETAARNHSQPLHNYFEGVKGIMTDDGNKSDDDDSEDDERNLYQVLIDDQIESGNSKSLLLAKKPRRSNMYSVQTGMKAISKIDEKGKCLTGNSKDVQFEKSNAFFLSPCRESNPQLPYTVRLWYVKNGCLSSSRGISIRRTGCYVEKQRFISSTMCEAMATRVSF
jgi:hypothetical protein